MAVAPKTKNANIGAATSDILKSIAGGGILSLINMHGHGLLSKVMWNNLN